MENNCYTQMLNGWTITTAKGQYKEKPNRKV